MSSQSTHVSLAGQYMVVAYVGDSEHQERGVYDSIDKGRAVAKMHWRDTGEMTDVLRLERPE